jgi:predicted nucleic acid-binding protein
MILVDTSVWVTHLRIGSTALTALLEQGTVACHPFVQGELACGNISNRKEVLGLIGALPQVRAASHDEVLYFIEEQDLAGKGLGYIDAHLLASALMSGVPLWTLDRNLEKCARMLNAAYI